MIKLLFGSNSYLGQNIILGNESRIYDWMGTSREPKNNILKDKNFTFIENDIINDGNKFKHLEVNEIYITSRPNSNNFDENIAFHSNLKKILLQLCTNHQVSKIVFTSSQMVYKITHDDVDLDTETMPYNVYEYFKLDMEIFLKLLYLKHNVPSISIYRLPLLFGGQINKKQIEEQYLYNFIKNFHNGHFWKFANDFEKSYGASWCYLPDLVEQFNKKIDGYNIINVSSGFVNYFELNKFMLKNVDTNFVGLQKLYESRMKMKTDQNIPQRNFLEILVDILAKSE